MQNTKVIELPESLFRRLKLTYKGFDDEARKYVKKSVNKDTLDKNIDIAKEKNWPVGDKVAIFIHKDKDDPTMHFLPERQYWHERTSLFDKLDLKDDKSYYIGKYLTSFEGHTACISVWDVSSVYVKRNYFEVFTDDGDVIQVPKDETKWAFLVHLGE